MPKYRAHLDPVWAALPPELKGSYLNLEERPDRQTARKHADRERTALVASYKDMRAARRRQYDRIALLEHGIGQSYGDDTPSLPGGKDRDPVGLFLSPNVTAAARDAARYPRARVKVVGSAILDTLPRRVGPAGRVVAVTWHWHYPRIPEMGSAWEHFKSALSELAAEYQVIGHAHPQAVGMVVDQYKRLGIEFEPSYRRVLERADVLVADTTSALYEFASTGRPVVVLNSPAYRRDVEFGLRFWDAADVGIQCDEPADLVSCVDEALADRPSRKAARHRALKLAYTFRTHTAARAAAQLVEWIS